MKLIKNMFYSTFYQILLVIVPLITAPYISRVLGTHGVGINSFTYSFMVYFALAAGLGITFYGNREIAFHHSDLKEKSKIFYELVILQGSTTLLAAVIYIIFVYFQHKYQMYFLLQGLGILAVALNISWFFMGVENFRIIVIRNSLINILIVILTFTLVKSSKDLWIYILLLTSSSLLANLSVWPFLRKEIVKVPLRELRILRHIAPSLLLFLPQITNQIYLSLNKSMLGVLDGVVASGYFNQSDMMIRTAFTAVSSFGLAFLPRLSSLLADKKHEEVKNLTLKSLDLMNAMTILAMAGIMGVSQTFAVFFFGKNFAAVGPLMFVESIAIIFFSLATVIGAQFMLATKRLKDYTLSSILALVVNIIFNIIFIPFIGVMGAVITTIITEFATTAYKIWAVRDVFKLSEIFHGFWKYLSAGVLTFVVLYTLNTHMSVSFLHYVIQTLIACLIYLGVILGLKAPVVSTLRPVISKLFKRV